MPERSIRKNAAKIPTDIEKPMFERFARDENIHLNALKLIFKNMVRHSDLVTIKNARENYLDLPIFPKELKEIDWVNPDRYELDALHTAMDAEMEAVHYYSRIRESTEDQLIIKILEEIISYERTHHSILHWQFSCLSQTGHWDEMTYFEEK